MLSGTEKLVGLTEAVAALHVKVTLTEPAPCPAKVNCPFDGQDGPDIDIFTGTCCPGVNTPLAGLKLTPLTVVEADQLMVGSPGLFELSEMESEHVQPLLYVQSVLAVIFGLLATIEIELQFQLTATGFVP